MKEHLHQEVGGAQGGGGRGIWSQWAGYRELVGGVIDLGVIIMGVEAGSGVCSADPDRFFCKHSNHGFYCEGCKVEADVHQSAPPHRRFSIRHITKWGRFFFLLY